ncbi:hypothetical protein ACHAO7_000015 [Fusarium culmorum]
MASHSEQCCPPGSDALEGEVIATPLTLDQMPNEIVLDFLKTMPDMNSLHAFAASCKTVYKIYQYNQVQVLTKVFLDKIDEGVYEEAVIAERLKRETWKDAQDGSDSICRVYESERGIRNQDVTLQDIKNMWSLHKSVEYFSDRLPTTLLRQHPVTNVEGHFSLTPSVRARFQRALYRLSSHFIIIEKIEALPDGGPASGGDPDWDVRHRWPVEPLTVNRHYVLLAFHKHYSAFEVEQLRCLSILLVTEIAPYFPDFLEHDIELGARLDTYIDRPLHQGGMGLVALGLPWLHRLLTAATRDDLYEIVRPVADHITRVWNCRLHPAFPMSDVPNYVEFGEPDNMSDPTFWETVDLWENGKIPDYVMRTPFFNDRDSGPASAWSSMSQFCMNLKNHGLNDWPFNLPKLPWAYVFWDLEMLENSGFENLDGDDEVEKNVVIPEDHPIIFGWEPLSNKYRLPPVITNLTLSAREKRKMLESGQTGYFDFETFCGNNKDKRLY